MNGYEMEFNEAIELLKTRGFVVAVNSFDYSQSVLYQYNFDTMRFEKTSADKLMDLWNKIYLNSYGRDYSFKEIILSLSNVSNHMLDKYHKHMEYLNQSFNLEKMQESTEILLNKNNARKKEIRNRFTSKALEIQYLINNDVFFDDGAFYRYNGKRFLYVSDLMRVFSKVAKENEAFLSSAYVNGNRTIYANHLTNANGIISDWFDYDLRERRLSETKADYDKISNLIKSFE